MEGERIRCVHRRHIVLLAACCLAGGAWAGEESTFTDVHLGRIAVYTPDGPPTSVAVLLSGDDGWNADAESLARELRGWGALVAGVDSTGYLRARRVAHDACTDAAADLEQVSNDVQKRAGLAAYRRPIVVGYASGATLAYAVAAQAPAGVLAGTVSLGFCPELPVRGGWCRGAGLDTVAAPGSGVLFRPRSTLPSPWIALHGENDRECSAAVIQSFLGGIPAAKFVSLPHAGHGLGVQDSWLPQLRDAYLKLVTRTDEARVNDAAVADLPLIETVATAIPAAGHRNELVVLLTGDGGWAGLDQALSARLAAEGVPVVALSTLQYFWRQRSPEQAAVDLDRIIRHYRAAWHCDRVRLIGYSFGANVLPFIVPRLSRDARDTLVSLSLLAPNTHTDFEVHVADWIPGSTPEGRPLAPMLGALRGTPVLCLHGSDDVDSLCPALPDVLGRSVALPGGHHFNDDWATLAKLILDFGEF